MKESEKKMPPKKLKAIWICEKCKRWSADDHEICDCGFFAVKTEAWVRDV